MMFQFSFEFEKPKKAFVNLQLWDTREAHPHGYPQEDISQWSKSSVWAIG